MKAKNMGLAWINSCVQYFTGYKEDFTIRPIKRGRDKTKIRVISSSGRRYMFPGSFKDNITEIVLPNGTTHITTRDKIYREPKEE